MKTEAWDRTATGPVGVLRVSPWRDRLVGFVWLVLGTVEAWIGLRVLLRAIGANPENPIARLVYAPTAVLLEPFEGLVRSPRLDDMVLEIHSLIALLLIAVLGWALTQLIDVVFPQPV